LNRGPVDYESTALPTELPRLRMCFQALRAENVGFRGHFQVPLLLIIGLPKLASIVANALRMRSSFAPKYRNSIA
jgi:hypothetical protein